MRIVSLVPSGTELLFALGAGDSVVGVSHECDYPAADPDVIVVMPCGFDEAGAGEQIAAIAGRPEWSSLRAVREGRAYPVDANGCFSRPGPRLVDGIERLATLFHGKLFAAAV
jgi:iron complex transport system substrate-binding protein